MDKYRLKRVREIWEEHPPVLALIDVLEELGDDMPWEVEVPTFPGHFETVGQAPPAIYLFFLPERIRKRAVLLLGGRMWHTPIDDLFSSSYNEMKLVPESKTWLEMKGLFIENCGKVAEELRLMLLPGTVQPKRALG